MEWGHSGGTGMWKKSVVLILACAVAAVVRAEIFVNKQDGRTLTGRVIQKTTKDGKEVLFVRLDSGDALFLSQDEWTVSEDQKLDPENGPGSDASRAQKAGDLIAVNRLLEAEELLRRPVTAQEKGFRAILIGQDAVWKRELGLTSFDAKEARRLATQALPVLKREWRTDALSCAILAQFYLDGFLVEEDDAEALKYCKQGAELGNSTCMFQMGRFYERINSAGIEKDPAQARRWFRQAIDAGSTKAMTWVGLLYSVGVGVKKDTDVARELCQRAAEKGDPMGMSACASILSTEIVGLLSQRLKDVKGTSGLIPKIAAKEKERFEWKMKGAEAGDASAMADLAEAHEQGNEVCVQDHAAAFKWYERAATTGVAEHLLRLARCYVEGIGTEKDLKEAHKLYDQAEVAARREKDDEALAEIEALRFLNPIPSK